MIKPIIEKGKAEKDTSLNNDSSNQPTPQILTAEEILQLAEDNANKDAYEINGEFYAEFLRQKFILLSQVESALKEILESVNGLGCHEAPNVCQCCKDNDKELKQIITKSFKEKLGVEGK